MKDSELFKTIRWKQLERNFILTHPICYVCGHKATKTKHVKVPAGDEALFFNEVNLASYCDRCYSASCRKDKERRYSK